MCRANMFIFNIFYVYILLLTSPRFRFYFCRGGLSTHSLRRLRLRISNGKIIRGFCFFHRVSEDTGLVTLPYIFTID